MNSFIPGLYWTVGTNKTNSVAEEVFGWDYSDESTFWPNVEQLYITSKGH